MPKRCVAAGCSNCSSEHVSLFSFPKDPNLLKVWTKQVQRTRDKWEPTPYSVLCSDHFTADSFEEAPAIQESLGWKVRYKRILKPTAIPTVFKRKPTTQDDTKKSKQRRETSTSKLARKRECHINTSCPVMQIVRHVASQTDPPDFEFPKMKSVGTQLSMKTLQNHIRSTATQVKITGRDCRDCSVGTITLPMNSPMLFLQPTLVKRPSKRPRLSLPDKKEGPSDSSMSEVVVKSEDST